MQLIIALKWWMVTALGIVLFSIIIFSSVLNPLGSHTKPVSSSLDQDEPFLVSGIQIPQDIIDDTSSTGSIQSTVGLPVRIRIPELHVDAPVEYVGLTPDGAMDVPKGPDDVAWFNLGPRPGEVGSAVIAGHYGWKNNIPAVFDNLHKLRVGDTISTEDESGAITTFVVRETRIYGKDDIVPEVFGSGDGKAHLNLVTCTGNWNREKKTFSERLVVFTDKE